MGRGYRVTRQSIITIFLRKTSAKRKTEKRENFTTLSLYDIMCFVLLGRSKLHIYVPANEYWRGSHLELSGTLPGRFARVIPLKTGPEQSGRVFARGVVLEPKTKGSMHRCALSVFLRTHPYVSALFFTGGCGTSESILDICRSQWRGC